MTGKVRNSILVICTIAACFFTSGCSSSSPENGVDIDLTSMSSTMVFSEVFDMVTKPDQYVGKTVRMEGAFRVYQHEDTGEYRYSCYIQDATACCAQGIEFIPRDTYRYPDAFPEQGEPVAVEGVFNYYEDGYNTYCVIEDADVYA